MALWLAAHPAALQTVRMQHNLADPGSSTLMQTVAANGVVAALSEFLRIYWSYFDPAFLFVQGGNARNLSTGDVGVFVIPVAILAIVGIWQLRAQRHVWWLLLICLLSAPVPAAIKGTPYQVQRASTLLIVVSLFAAYGAGAWWSSGRATARVALIVAALISAHEFSTFYRDYHGGYRLRSAHVYDRTAFTGAAEAILAGDTGSSQTPIYLPAGLYDASAKWRFHVTKHNRVELLSRTRYFPVGIDTLPEAPLGAWAVVPVLPADGAARSGWQTVMVVRDLSGEPTLAVLRRLP